MEILQGDATEIQCDRAPLMCTKALVGTQSKQEEEEEQNKRKEKTPESGKEALSSCSQLDKPLKVLIRQVIVLI